VPIVIYYDLTSAESFAVSEVVQSLPAASAIEWRGVQMEPTLPAVMARLDRRAAARVEMDIVAAKKSVPSVRYTVPPGRPNTRLALQAVASVDRMHPARASALRVALFRAYWWSGVDISDVAAVRAIAADAGVPPWVELEHQAAQAAQVGWELQWQAERLGGVPRIIRSDGRILWQLTDEGSLRAFLAGDAAGN
jgi:2-hydroxychromene-2-carboxylate isomerase